MKGKFAFYLAVAAIVFAGQFLRSGDLVTGTPPPIALRTLGGIPASAIVGQGPAAIYFWGKWCGVCAMMQDTVSAVSADYPLLSVALRSGDDDALNRYLHEKRLSWQVINDPKGDIASLYGVKAVPSLFFVNGKGNIVFTSVGYTSEWGLRFRLWLAGWT